MFGAITLPELRNKRFCLPVIHAQCNQTIGRQQRLRLPDQLTYQRQTVAPATGRAFGPRILTEPLTDPSRSS